MLCKLQAMPNILNMRKQGSGQTQSTIAYTGYGLKKRLRYFLICLLRIYILKKKGEGQPLSKLSLMEIALKTMNKF